MTNYKYHKSAFLIDKFLASSKSYELQITASDIAILFVCAKLMDKGMDKERILYGCHETISFRARLSRPFICSRFKWYVKNDLFEQITNYRGRPNSFRLGKVITSCNPGLHENDLETTAILECDEKKIEIPCNPGLLEMYQNPDFDISGQFGGLPCNPGLLAMSSTITHITTKALMTIKALKQQSVVVAFKPIEKSKAQDPKNICKAKELYEIDPSKSLSEHLKEVIREVTDE